MTALVEGTWTTIGVAFVAAAVVSLSASVVFLVLSFWQDREERTRPERRLVSVEETAAVSRQRWSAVSLGFTIVAILVVIVLAMFGV
jgi:type II secretory pathway pseudopilin PulG